MREPARGTTIAEQKAYQRGYNRAANRQWPEHFLPPMPPNAQLARLLGTAKSLYEAGTHVVQVIICDTEPFIQLQQRVYALEDELIAISDWLRGNDGNENV